MKKIFKYALLLIISGCNGDNNTTTGNPLVSLSIQATAPGSLSLSALNLQPVAIDIKNSSGVVEGNLNITSARIALKEIEFELENTQDEEMEFDFEGPFVVDLLQGTVSPSLSQINLPTGLYKEVKLKIDKIEGDELDESGGSIIPPTDPLFGKSILVSGLYTGPTSNAGNVTNAPFQMSFDLDDELELTGANDTSLGFNIEDGDVNALILAFRISKWIDFSNTETNPSGLEPSQIEVTLGEINLDEASTGNNADIRELVYKNIKESLDYGKDLDEDGRLDIDEDDDPDSEDDDDE